LRTRDHQSQHRTVQQPASSNPAQHVHQEAARTNLDLS
jgi:hypothetical protein